MHLLDFFDKFSLRPENAKELKGLILDLAIRGRLTEEWRKENPINLSPAGRGAGGGTTAGIEPASVLLQRIQAEKARLVKEKKIKKEKPLPEITEEEIPFELPDGWEWCRFQEIFDIRDGTHDSPKDSLDHKTYPLITSKNFENGQINFDRARRISEEDYLKAIQRSEVHTGDVLFSMIGGNIGNQVEVGEFTEYAIKNVALFKHYRYGVPAPGYLKVFSKYIAMDLQTKAAGGAQPFVSLKFFRNLVLGLPPLPEQQAIVAIVNQLMAEVDELQAQTTERAQLRQNYVQSALRRLTTEDSEAAWQRLQPHVPDFFDTVESIDKLKEAILQLAVQGKLTRQWRKENPITLSPSGGGAGGGTTAGIEPASVLLQRIQAEKARLIKEKKIKKEKPLPEITEAEIPFGLPEGWEWCRLWELCPNISSGSTPPKPYFTDSGIPYLKVYNIRNQEIDFNYRSQYVDNEYHSTKLKRSILHPGDIIYNIVGPPLGKTAIIPNDFPEWNCNQAIAFFKPVIKEMNVWIYTYLLSKVYLADIELIGTAGQDNISVTKSKMIKVPLPSLPEQQAIVTIVNQLMAHCDEMKAEIERRNALSKDFLQASIREVMG